MGMHTAEPVISEDGRYHGMGVHRAARIMAAGHGAQVLASQATASVLFDDELDGIALRDLGEHELKDFDRPERIYQLDIDGLTSVFPPLQTSVPRGNFELLAASLRADARDPGRLFGSARRSSPRRFPTPPASSAKDFAAADEVRAIDLELGEHRYRLEAWAVFEVCARRAGSC